MANELGVSQMALYEHVSGLRSLKELVAEETLLRWRLPDLRPGTRADLKRYLMELAVSTWTLFEAHPGIGPYLLREDMIMPSIVAKIRADREDAAAAFGLSFEQANWLLFTVAYHCVAVADTVLPRRAGEAQPASAPGEDGIDPEYAEGIRALIVGALVLLDDDDQGCPRSAAG